MDIISWVVALVAGLAQPSLRRAIVIGVATSIALRVYGFFATDWGDTMPEDLFGGAAMIAVTVVFAWIGSLVRARPDPHRLGGIVIAAAQARDLLVLVAIALGVGCLLVLLATFDPRVRSRLPVPALADGKPVARVGLGLAGVAAILVGIG